MQDGLHSGISLKPHRKPLRIKALSRSEASSMFQAWKRKGQSSSGEIVESTDEEVEGGVFRMTSSGACFLYAKSVHFLVDTGLAAPVQVLSLCLSEEQ